jgi:hypothetical protein
VSALRDILGEAWRELWRARLRTLLAVGAIAVGALGVSVIASGMALERVRSAQARGKGWLSIAMPYLTPGPLQAPSRMKRRFLLPEDGEYLRAACPDLDQLVIAGSTSTHAKVGSEVMEVMLELDSATTQEAFVAQPMRGKLARGRHFTPQEVAGGAHVAILSDDVRRRLFGNRPVGRWLRLDGVRFEIVGAQEPRPTRELPVYTVAIPYTAGRHLYLDARWSFYAYARPERVPEVLRSINRLFAARVGEPHAPFAYVLGEQDTLGDRRTLIYFGMVGLLMLLSAALALSNKMYVDVLERLDQIALRRALGATARRIYAGVLLESTVLCGLGCAVGGGLGWALFLSFSIRERGSLEGGMGFPLLPALTLLAATITLGLAAGGQAAAVALTADPARMLNRKDAV